jgi:transposase InsO family protein
MQLYVPAAGGSRTEVLCRHHDDPIARHLGAKRTLEPMARKYYWPGMSLEVKAYTRACLTYQYVHPMRHRPHRSMEPLPQLRDSWTDISMDFIVGFPESRRKRHAKPHNAILIVVYWYTKQPRYFPCHDSLDAIRLAEILARQLVLRGAGVPQRINSNRGPQLTSKFWAAFCHHLPINRWLSTAYHPQTDSENECQNQTLEQ